MNLFICMRFQMERKLLDSQSQLQALRSEVISLQREVKTLDLDCNQLRFGWDQYKPSDLNVNQYLVLMIVLFLVLLLRAQQELDVDIIRQLTDGERERERIMEEKERQLVFLTEQKQRDGGQLKEVKRERMDDCIKYMSEHEWMKLTLLLHPCAFSGYCRLCACV